MIIQPRTWGFICTTAHPAGCAANIRDQIAHVRHDGLRSDGPKRVLVIGASTGYGLAARISAAFGFGAATLGVFLEKPARGRKTASAGWYNSAAFEEEARQAGLTSVSLNADAFAHATRKQTIELIHSRLGGPVDLVIYSLAAPVRRLPDTGDTAHTALRPIGNAFTGTTIDTDNDTLTEVSVDPASEQEINDTVSVMGGDDWTLWINALRDADALAPHARTVAFSYLGPELTWPIYRHGTIGRAKAHLEQSAQAMCDHVGDANFARVAVLKSIVTQASAAIPVIPLYLSVVSQVMKDRGLHEGAIEQQNRLFRDYLYPATDTPPVDSDNRLRLDDRELAPEIQKTCQALWPGITSANLASITDYDGYKREFLRLFGFGCDDVDYAVDTNPAVAIDNLVIPGDTAAPHLDRIDKPLSE